MPPKRTQSQRKSKLKKTTVVASLADLVAGKDASTKKFGKAPATTEKYEQRCKQGLKWLKELLKSEEGLEHPAGCPESLASTLNWEMAELKHAFDRKPTRASPWVLSLFIASKCFGDEERGVATAWQIYASFKLFWSQSFVYLFTSLPHRSDASYRDPNGIYQGRWQWDDVNKVGRGNPAESSEVRDTMTAVKNRQGATGTREHSAAMKIEYMDRIMSWSNNVFAPSVLKRLGPMKNVEYHTLLPTATKHLFFRAFATSGWNLWTR